MTAGGRSRSFRPESWSLVTRGTVILGLSVILGAMLLAILVNRTINDLQLQSQRLDFEDFAQDEARRLVRVIESRLSVDGLGRLAREVTLVERVEELNASEEQSVALVPGGDESVRQQIGRFLQANQQYPLLLITDGTGRLVASNLVLQQVEFSGEEWFAVARSGVSGDIFLSDQRDTSAIAGVRGVEIAIPVVNALNQDVGVLYAVWDTASDPGVNLPAVGQANEVLLLNREGELVGGFGSDRGLQAVFGPQVVDVVLRSDEVGSIEAFDGRGIRTVYAYSQLEQGATFALAEVTRELEWTVVLTQDTRVMLASAQALIRRVFILIAAVTLLVVVTTVAFLRALIAPLGRLTLAAQRIGDGDLDTPIPQLGEDEVGRLADVLRGTVSQLVKRVTQLRSAAQVTSIAQTALDVGRLLNEVAKVLHREFSFEQVRVYLLEPDSDSLALEAAAGEADMRLRKQKHRIAVDSHTIIGRAVQEGYYQVQRGEEASSGHGSELAVPMRGGADWIGSLYLTSDQPDAFGADELNIIELMADQLSVAVQNARLFEQSTTNLRQIEALNQRLTKEGWDEFVGSSGQMRHVLSVDDENGVDGWPAEMDGVARNGTMVAKSQLDDDGRALLAVPIILSGEIIGTLGIRRPEGHRWSEDEITLVQSVAERVGTIAEGIRRLDEANRATQREQLTGAVSARLQRATEVDSLLKMALDELSGALGSDSVALRLGTPPADDGSVEGRDASS